MAIIVVIHRQMVIRPFVHARRTQVHALPSPGEISAHEMSREFELLCYSMFYSLCHVVHSLEAWRMRNDNAENGRLKERKLFPSRKMSKWLPHTQATTGLMPLIKLQIMILVDATSQGKLFIPLAPFLISLCAINTLLWSFELMPCVNNRVNYYLIIKLNIKYINLILISILIQLQVTCSWK